MPKPLSGLERDVLDWLVDYVRSHTYQPSIREIGAQFEIRSTKTVSELLQSLADKGWIERDSSRSRGVRLLGLELDADVVSVPHLDVALDDLGPDDLTLDDFADNLTLDRRIAGSAGSFLVTMVGDTMREDGIRDGDLVLVEPLPVAELIDGDLVLCYLGDGAGVRRLRRDGDRVVLDAPRPATRGGEDDHGIVGRIGAVIRRLRTDSPLGRVTPEPADEGLAAS